MPEPTRAELKYQVERQLEEIRTVNEVGRLLSSTTDPREIVRLVASYLRQTFPLALCGILLIEPRKLHVIQFTKIARVDLDAAIRELCQKASDPLPPAQRFTEEGLSRTLEDHSLSAGPQGHGAIGYLRSSYAAPLRFKDQTIGWLSVFSGKIAAFTTEEQHVIDIVAAQLGASLRNAFLLDELQRANQLKNDLLMVISHELRIPLTSIKEGVGLIRDGALGPVNAEQQDFLTTVDESAARLESLVEKVVTATQVVTGQLQYAFADLDLGAVLKEAAGAVGLLAHAKGVALDSSGVASTLGCTGDRKRLTQAVENVLENAVHATPANGRVTVTAATADGGIILHVTDTGPGIPAEELPRIFEQFRQVGGVDNRKTGGLGLGLFLTKQIVTAHGGTVHLESQVGQGTRVTIQLPQHPPTSPPPRA